MDSDSILWDELVDSGSNISRLLPRIMGPDIRPFFQMRAAAAFFAPFLETIPFHWIEEIKTGNPFFARYIIQKTLPAIPFHPIAGVIRSFMREFDFDEFPLYVIHFSADIVCLVIDALCNADESIPERDNLLDKYNHAIIKLLAALEETDAHACRLFDRFSLRDDVPYGPPPGINHAIDDESGYNPFGWLLRERDIPEHWKVLADQQMRKIIQDEMSGTSSPREEWEDARVGYEKWVMELMLFNTQSAPEGPDEAEDSDSEGDLFPTTDADEHEEPTYPYSDDLFISQLRFLLGIWETAGERFSKIVTHEVLIELVIRLNKNNVPNIQKQLARLWLRHGQPSYFTGSHADIESFVAIIEAIDPELGNQVHVALALPEIRHEEGWAGVRDAMQNIENILSRMRQ
ncbi:MAG: hypothetical protein HY617_02940 [Candidatus Sungbacteria bacterium]|nr:hypothetical protein [Candidatus Sungbacteria bacterium]